MVVGDGVRRIAGLPAREDVAESRRRDSGVALDVAIAGMAGGEIGSCNQAAGVGSVGEIERVRLWCGLRADSARAGSLCAACTVPPRPRWWRDQRSFSRTVRHAVLSRLVKRICSLDEGEGLFAGGGGAFELGVFGQREHGLELRRRAIAGGDQVAAGEQRRGAQVGRGLGFVLGAGEVVERQVAVGGGGVDAMQFQVLVEARQAKEALQRGLLHLQDVAEAHVVLDQREDLRGVVVGEAQAREDILGDADADLDVAVEADAVAGNRRIRRLIGRGLADVVQQRAPRQRWRAAGGSFSSSSMVWTQTSPSGWNWGGWATPRRRTTSGRMRASRPSW